MSNAIPIIRQAGEGEHLGFAGGGVFTVKASGAETGGAFLLMTHRSVGGKSTPLHTHPEDEAIYVLEGELLVHMDGEEHRVGQGGFFVAPRGVPHAMLVTSETAHMLVLQTPGTGEAFYRDASDPVDGVGGCVVAARLGAAPGSRGAIREHSAGRPSALRRAGSGGARRFVTRSAADAMPGAGLEPARPQGQPG